MEGASWQEDTALPIRQRIKKKAKKSWKTRRGTRPYVLVLLQANATRRRSRRPALCSRSLGAGYLESCCYRSSSSSCCSCRCAAALSLHYYTCTFCSSIVPCGLCLLLHAVDAKPRWPPRPTAGIRNAEQTLLLPLPRLLKLPSSRPVPMASMAAGFMRRLRPLLTPLGWR